MANSKSKNQGKPTVFLSHSSNNRRELLALKRFLDERAGGFVEFFLSSDEESIIHGTIWPAEVKAALDRMKLMLIFVSTEALKSGWTYFEAGYGLHKLGTTNIYCLPGTDKALLPSPFDIIQNRNLHSPREVGLLIRQINELFGGKMAETVSKEDFDKIFKRPSLGQIETGPHFDQLVESVTVEILGPFNSIEIFSNICRSHELPSSITDGNHLFGESEARCSTGVKIIVEVPSLYAEEEEFIITDDIRKNGEAEVCIFRDSWTNPNPWQNDCETRSLAEIEAYNAKIQKKNKKIKQDNIEELAKPRNCEFVLSPINISLPISTVDYWLDKVGIKKPIITKIKLLSDVVCESRVEAISAKIHGSQLSLREDGKLQWFEQIILTNDFHENRLLTLTAPDTNLSKLAKFQIEELVSTLFELKILSFAARGNKKRR